MKITVYDTTTGRIVGVPSIADPELREMQRREGCDWIEGTANARTQYVADVDDAPVLADRPVISDWQGGSAPVTLGMSDLPEPATVTVTEQGGGASVSTSDPADPVRLTAPGSYEVAVDLPWPWQPHQQMIEVTDA